MSATRIDGTISKMSPMLLAAALSSLATSWFYQTPRLHQKEQRLEVVEQKIVPHLQDVAGCQTVRARVATSLAQASENGASVDLTDIPHCPLPPKMAAEKKASSDAAALKPPIMQ